MIPTKSDIDPKALLEAYRSLVKSVLQGSENVGRGFAEEARKIHYEEVPVRKIHGQVTPEERDELRDEGVSVLPILTLEDEGSVH